MKLLYTILLLFSFYFCQGQDCKKEFLLIDSLIALNYKIINLSKDLNQQIGILENSLIIKHMALENILCLVSEDGEILDKERFRFLIKDYKEWITP